MAMQSLKMVNLIVVHGAYTPPDMDVSVQDVRKWHTDPPNSWDDVGYHFFIRRDGTWEQGRPLPLQGAHAFPKNEGSIGICMAGGKGKDGVWEFNYSWRQIQTLKIQLLNLREVFPMAQIEGHRDVVDNRECPGFNVRALEL